MSDSLEWTFAYGSNMDVDGLRSWLKDNGHIDARVDRWERATLAGHCLVWNYYSRTRRGGAANVKQCEGASLPGVALQLNSAGLAAVDRKEGHPKFYSRGEAPVTVQLSDGTSVRAWLYIAVSNKCRLTKVPPTREYLDIIIKAAERHSLPADHIEMLRGTPTAVDSDG
jgi:hypothetical protein